MLACNAGKAPFLLGNQLNQPYMGAGGEEERIAASTAPCFSGIVCVIPARQRVAAASD